MVYTYALIYYFDSTSSSEDVYNSCIDGRMIADDDDYSYCTALVESAGLEMWETSDIESACEKGEIAMQAKCDPTTATECHACAWTIAYIYTKYDTYTDQSLENVYL